MNTLDGEHANIFRGDSANGGANIRFNGASDISTGATGELYAFFGKKPAIDWRTVCA